jgi:hypothetical protein
MIQSTSIGEALDHVLSDFDQNSSRYPVSTLLTIFQASGAFNPSLLKQLQLQLTSDNPGGSEVYMSKEELNQQLSNPDTLFYRKEDSTDIFNILRNGKPQIVTSELASTTEQQALLSNNLVKESYSRWDIEQLMRLMENRGS